MPKSDNESCFKNIAKRAKRGDETAFVEIFDHFYPEILGFVTNQNNQFELDVSDITQLVFVKAAKSIHQLKSPENLRAWLYQIARNCIHDARRKVSRDRDLHIALVSESSPSGNNEDSAHSDVHDWINQLDDKMKETVTLVYFQGLSHREAGNVMGCAEGTISWRVSEAIKSLKSMAEKERGSE